MVGHSTHPGIMALGKKRRQKPKPNTEMPPLPCLGAAPGAGMHRQHHANHTPAQQEGEEAAAEEGSRPTEENRPNVTPDIVFSNMHRKLCRDMQKTLAAAKIAATSSPPITAELLPALKRMCTTINRLTHTTVTGKWASH
jgi:hypothetical protein